MDYLKVLSDIEVIFGHKVFSMPIFEKTLGICNIRFCQLSQNTICFRKIEKAYM